MADSDYQPFHYTRVFKAGWLSRGFQAECVCGWVSHKFTTQPGAGSKAALHLLERHQTYKQARQEAPTEELHA